MKDPASYPRPYLPKTSTANTSAMKTAQDTTAGLLQPSASAEAVKKAVEEMNKKMMNSVAQFGIHEETNHLTIKIVDKETRKVIKELPPEKTLDMIAKVWEMAGLLVDEKR